MQPIHSGLQNRALFNGNAFRSVAICLDSGKLATDACRADARGIDRVVYVNVYPGDEPTEACDKHVMMKRCSDSGYVATEYCSMFPGNSVFNAGFVRLTAEEIQEIRDAAKVGLNDAYLNAGGIYYLGADAWHGFYNEYGSNDKPYLECPIHSAGSWKDYEDSTTEDSGFVESGDDQWVDGDG